MQDMITAAKWLRTKPFVAKDRIWITGSSYGGYTTMMALTFGAEHFNYGVAGASVTDWKLYDTVYTERYMDTPAENPEGYKNGAVLTWIDRYKGLLRITHGTIDDNVHMQNSMQVIDWLVSNNRKFELMLYPDSRHGTQASQRPHQTREAHDFWVRTLLDGKLPAEPTTNSTNYLARPNGRNPIKSKPQRRRGRRENKTAGVGTGFCCHLGWNPGSKRRWMDATVDQTSSAALASGIPAQMNGAQRRPCGTAKARVHWSPSVKSVVSAFSVSACSASPR
jgi:hypothetical protein